VKEKFYEEKTLKEKFDAFYFKPKEEVEKQHHRR
jgi:hypothetical protein